MAIIGKSPQNTEFECLNGFIKLFSSEKCMLGLLRGATGSAGFCFASVGWFVSFRCFIAKFVDLYSYSPHYICNFSTPTK